MRSPLATALFRSVTTLPILLAGIASAGIADPAVAGDTVRTRFVEAATGLLDSAPTDTPTLTHARARGHLARMQGEIDPAELRTLRTPRARLAWLEAAMADRGLAAGESAEIARRATREALDLLAESHPDDPAVRLDRMVSAIESAEGDSVDLGDLRAADLGHRPFAASPDAICDRLVAGRGAAAAIAMLDLADDAVLPEVVASVVAAGLDADPDVAARLDALDHSSTGIGPTVIFELARRQAGHGVDRYVQAYPVSVVLPGVRTAAITAVAPADPEAAIALAGSVEVLDRLPGAGRIAVRTGLARGLAATDPDAAWDQANQAGQLDDRIIAFMAARSPGEDPGRMLDDVKSLRTVAPGRLVGDLVEQRLDRETAIEAIADLFRTGRYDLAYSLLIPNTTELARPADQWLPTRIDLLAEALVRADAAPDAFIPLLASTARLHGVDAQTQAFADLATSLGELDEQADLPEPLREVLSEVLVEIALRG